MRKLSPRLSCLVDGERGEQITSRMLLCTFHFVVKTLDLSRGLQRTAAEGADN